MPTSSAVCTNWRVTRPRPTIAGCGASASIGGSRNERILENLGNDGDARDNAGVTDLHILVLIMLYIEMCLKDVEKKFKNNPAGALAFAGVCIEYRNRLDLQLRRIKYQSTMPLIDDVSVVRFLQRKHSIRDREAAIEDLTDMVRFIDKTIKILEEM